RKSELGQFLTPLNIARFMASLFSADRLNSPRLLDPGAGIGSLTSAFLERVINENVNTQVQTTAVEIDTALTDKLNTTLSWFEGFIELDRNIIQEDFIVWATKQLLDENSLFEADVP